MAKLTLTLLTLLVFMAGCIAFGAKKTLLVAQQTKTKAIEQPITVENQPKTLCPKLKSGSHNYTTFNFLYVLDTTDKNCIATKWQDLFGEEKLFPIQKDVNLVFEGKQPGGSIYSACRFQEDHNYVQYYKGIKVEGSRIMLTYDKGKIVRLVGTYYPHLNIDTTGMLSKEEAAMLVLKERNTPAEAYTRTIQYMLNYSDLKVDPIRQRITYSFWFILGEKSGTYVVNALTGLVTNLLMCVINVQLIALMQSQIPPHVQHFVLLNLIALLLIIVWWLCQHFIMIAKPFMRIVVKLAIL